ncbi:g11669 [Coccomyxa viridis]|uniref:G11669 protein n=1 Tax=Coccomyxa viridis TaxID=1274662 RepID=A0ABP1G9M3_9CHLO
MVYSTPDGKGGLGHPRVQFSVAQSFLKGEDVVLAKPEMIFPALDTEPPAAADKRESSDAGSDDASHLQRTSVYDSVTSAESKSPFQRLPQDHSSSIRDTPSKPSTGEVRHSKLGGDNSFGLYCVFDGHNGVAAAQHIHDTLVEALWPLLPAGTPPPESDAEAYRLWREQLQQALVCALDEVQVTFACIGHPSGTTVTIVIQCGWLLTIANLGDSRAVLDTGAQILQLSVDHRVATHRAERHRLERTGALIAPIDVSGQGPAAGPYAQGWGPLRVWPGGLCLSRALGDFDVGSLVLAIPHIMQVKVPQSGVRVLVASDGVWDAFEKMLRVCRMARSWSVEEAPHKLIKAIERAHGGLKDDTSIIVLDLLPPGKDFPAIAGRTKQATASKACMCFSPSPAVKEDDDYEPPGQPEVVADIDFAEVCASAEGDGVAVPSWYQHEYGAELMHSQEAAVEAWKEACAMRRSGKEPSRVDLASYFSSALQPDVEIGVPEVAPQVYSARASRDRGKAQATKHISFAPETQDIGKPIPAVYGGSPAQQRQRPPPHVMDYTVKAGIRPTSPATDYSTRAGTQYNGGMTSQVASACAAARNLDRSQHGPGDASIRYGRAHFAPSQEGFAQQFGPYAGNLIQGEGSSHGSGHGKGPTTQHFPAAVAKNEDIQHEPLSLTQPPGRNSMDLRAAQQMTDSGHEQVNGTAPAGAAAAATDSAPADCGSFADSERLSDSQRRLSIIRETPDRANLERRSPAEGRVKGGGQALSSLSQKENAAGNLAALKQKLQNGILKAK